MIWIEEENMKDRLQEIWERQKNFDNIVFANAGVTREQVANEIKVALITEIGELYNENPTFKFWKEQKNIEILTCKTSAEYYKINKNIPIGHFASMEEIIEKLFHASKIIQW